MESTIVTSIISLTGTLIGTFSGIIVANKLTNYRIAQLEKKVEKHNQLVERTYKIENKIAVLENREKSSEHRIDDLEEIHKQ